MNRVELVGTLAGNPLPGVMKGGGHYCTFKVKCSPDPGRTTRPTFALICYDDLCTQVEKLRDGDAIHVAGRLSNRQRKGGVGVPDRWELTITATEIVGGTPAAPAVAVAASNNEYLADDIPF